MYIEINELFKKNLKFKKTKINPLNLDQCF